MNRIRVSLLCLSLASCAGGEPGPQGAPNILVIVADDLAPGMLGSEGNEVIRTPNIDTLAAAGTSFSRAYVPLPQCGPSRAALLFGRYPHEIGVLSNPDAWSGEGSSIADVLGASGYRCGLVGKWHLGGDPDAQAGFDDFWRTIDRDHRSYVDPVLWIDGERHQPEGYLPEILTDHAIEFIDTRDERPFFLWLAYKTPHEPFTVPPDPAFAHDPATLTFPESLSDDLASKPAAQRDSVLHQRYLDKSPGDLRQVVSTYYAMISALDHSIGRLLDHLASGGLAKNTVVVFLSDNGLMAGEHSMITKGPAFYEELVRTPLIIRWPGHAPAGARRDALISTLDLFPTLTALAGATDPAGLAGMDVMPLVRGDAAALREELFLEYSRRQGQATPMLGVVTASHKYVRYLGSGEEELYDLRADPLELQNIAGTPEGRPELERLRGRVAEFQDSIAEPFW
jgi:N-acetylglucosamine-6-sulfatase